LPFDPTDTSVFKDRAVLVTGANSGLGHAAAIKYAVLGASPLILAVRSQEKGEQAKEAIIQATGCSPEIFIIETVDFASMSSVQEFCERLNARLPALHIIQHAAGIALWEYQRSPDGYEMTLQVNVLAQALLALLLLPKMHVTAEADKTFTPHISFLNSVGHREVESSDFPSGQSLIKRMDDEVTFDHIKQYYFAKLASWYVMQGIVDRCEGTGIVVNSTCCGLCKTNLSRSWPWYIRFIMKIQYIVAGRTPEQGARTLVSATALGPESNGRFWTNDRFMG